MPQWPKKTAAQKIGSRVVWYGPWYGWWDVGGEDSVCVPLSVPQSLCSCVPVLPLSCNLGVLGQIGAGARVIFEAQRVGGGTRAVVGGHEVRQALVSHQARRQPFLRFGAPSPSLATVCKHGRDGISLACQMQHPAAGVWMLVGGCGCGGCTAVALSAIHGDRGTGTAANTSRHSSIV